MAVRDVLHALGALPFLLYFAKAALYESAVYLTTTESLICAFAFLCGVYFEMLVAISLVIIAMSPLAPKYAEDVVDISKYLCARVAIQYTFNQSGLQLPVAISENAVNLWRISTNVMAVIVVGYISCNFIRSIPILINNLRYAVKSHFQKIMEAVNKSFTTPPDRIAEPATTSEVNPVIDATATSGTDDAVSDHSGDTEEEEDNGEEAGEAEANNFDHDVFPPEVYLLESMPNKIILIDYNSRFAQVHPLSELQNYIAAYIPLKVVATWDFLPPWSIKAVSAHAAPTG